jgi:Protein of unknown function (DUF3822)
VKQEYHIESAKKDETAQQVLSIRIGERHFGFAITSLNAGELYKLVWYTDVDIDTAALTGMIQQHADLKPGYHHTFICYDYPQSVLVPLNHYKQDDAKLLLQSMFGISGKDSVVTEPVPGWQLHNIYAVPKEVYDWAYQHFPSSNYWHTYSIGIRNSVVTDFEGSLAADFRTDEFALVVSRGTKVLLTQTFTYTTPADVIYYLLDICRQFSFQQETVRVSLSGLIAKDSALYKELYQYFLHLRFRESEWRISQQEETVNYPPHFFTSLNDLARCAL